MIRRFARWFASFRINPADDGFIRKDVLNHWWDRLRHTRRSSALDANVLMAPIMWLMRAAVQAEPIVQERTGGEWVDVEDHDAALLLEDPNPAYGGDELMSALVLSYGLSGNAYALKVRDNLGEVRELWYLPHWTVEPMYPPDGRKFIDHYAYRPLPGMPGPEKIAPRDIIHLRFGLNPVDVRRGLSPVGPVLREVLTDEEASDFTSYILKNMGVPGGIISPPSGEAKPNEKSVKAIKQYMNEEFSGSKRGSWLVLGAPTDVKTLGVDPNRMMVGPLRDIAEERVCSALGIPAAVVGFGAGLQQTKVGATMRELVRLAWVNAVTPLHRTFGKQLGRQLVRDWMDGRYRVRYDMTGISMFPADEKDRSDRAIALYEAKLADKATAQKIAGLPVTEEEEGARVPPTPGGPSRLPPTPAGNTNGGIR